VPLQLTALRTRVARRILGLFIVCAFVPIGSLAVLSYRRVTLQVTQQAAQRLHEIAKGAGMVLMKRLTDVDDLVRTLAEQRSSSLPPIAAAPSATPDDPRSWITGYVRVDSGGAVRAVAGDSTLPPPLPANGLRTLRSGEPLLLIPDSTRVWIVRSVGPSLLWADVHGPALWGIDRTDEVLPAGTSLCILTAAREPLHCPVGVPPPLLDAMPPTTATGFPLVTWRRGGEDFLASPWSLFLHGRFSAPPLTVAVSQPSTSILAPMADFRRTFPLAVLLTLVLALALAYWLIRRSTEPLVQLQDGTRRLAALDFSHPVQVASHDEFQDLASSFNTMASQVQQANASLHESEARLRTILETAPEGVVTTDAAGTIESVNRAAERLFDRRREDLIGQPAAQLLSDGADADPFREPGERELLARRTGGDTVSIQLSTGEARLGERSVFTSFVRDISDRKRAEAERADLEAQLRQAQKLETIGTLAGGIAHDFNNILAAVIGYLHLALADLPPGTPAREYLLEVQRAAGRATDLARQILLFSRRTEQRRQLVLLGEIVEEALHLLRASLPTTIEIRRHIDPEIPPIEADPTQIHQVLMNLCTNAAHAMHGTGVLALGLTVTDLAPGQAEAPATLGAGRYVRLTVRDTGHGMDPGTMERIFEPFFTTKPPGEGTGLGLSVVHGIVAAHGGAIHVESAPGRGTTFAVYLPVSAAAAPAVAASVPGDLAGQERVLVVDDDAPVATVTQRVLERSGYRVTMRTSSAEALALVRDDPAQFDLLLTDQTMPQLTGMQLAGAVHALRPDLPIILTSGFAEVPGAAERRALGVRELLLKPANPRDLMSAVRRVLDQQSMERA
jgi:two-component system cell cycle sensor histidine kinase/response regulator CckA